MPTAFRDQSWSVGGDHKSRQYYGVNQDPDSIAGTSLKNEIGSLNFENTVYIKEIPLGVFLTIVWEEPKLYTAHLLPATNGLSANTKTAALMTAATML